MEITQLEFFLKVVEEGSFSKAAERVYRTQPAVSLAIRRLEEEVGASLLDRSQKSPTLTDVGRVVYEHARRIIALRDRAREAVAEVRALQRGRVRIGANESTSLYLLPDLILEFRGRHPNVLVEMFRHASQQLPREVIDRNLDFAIMAFEPADSALESFPVLKDELALIMSPNHHLAARESVSLEELGAESFLAHNVRAASRNRVVEAFAEHHAPLNIILELATIETIKRFVQKEVGIAFVPRMCVAEELERGTLVTIPVRGLTYERVLWATSLRGATLSHAATAFLELLRQRSKTTGGSS
ncbi:MAG TPA: LysR family transcriptional regulator [Pyrinomonadaceae bacterium]|jgi:DNA-binding transcriptional LysR family regulator|nr:LysR family transcriptional regulator [Pyrinomonadaceae bacterium]